MSFDLATLITFALNEDGADNDISGRAAVDIDQQAQATVIAKADGIISGLQLVGAVCDAVGGLNVEYCCADGDRVTHRTPVLHITGDGRSLLVAERTLLNLLGRMSAVATATASYVEAVAGTGCIIKDTRKTTPLWRQWERAAVVHGGGYNHRDNLSSMIMMKENHLRCAGGLTEGIARAQRASNGGVYEIEVTNLEEFTVAHAAGVPRIMVDNFSLSDTQQAVDYNRQAQYQAVLEASGNMTLDRVGAVAATGVDEISIGALTHSAPIFDLSLLVNWL